MQWMSFAACSLRPQTGDSQSRPRYQLGADHVRQYLLYLLQGEEGCLEHDSGKPGSAEVPLRQGSQAAVVRRGDRRPEEAASIAHRVEYGRNHADAGPHHQIARIALARGDNKQALQLFRQALSKEWPAREESRRRAAQLEYAGLLSGAGRKNEAISLLLSMIEQHGDDSALGERALSAPRT